MNNRRAATKILSDIFFNNNQKTNAILEHLEKFDNAVLAIEVIDGFTKNDEKICQKFFEEKIKQGFDKVNVLVKLDEMKISHSSTKAFFEDIVWEIRNYEHPGHLAIVAHSKIIKVLVPIDNLFFERANKGRLERYFDVSQINEAFEFVNPDKKD